MYCADEIYDVYNEIAVTARLAHRCGACGEPIRPGDVYHRIALVFDHRASTVKRCARCQVIHLHLRDVAEPDSWPDERLNCGDDYEDVIGCAPPPEIAALAFALPGEDL